MLNFILWVFNKPPNFVKAPYLRPCVLQTDSLPVFRKCSSVPPGAYARTCSIILDLSLSVISHISSISRAGRYCFLNTFFDLFFFAFHSQAADLPRTTINNPLIHIPGSSRANPLSFTPSPFFSPGPFLLEIQMWSRLHFAPLQLRVLSGRILS